MDELGPGIRCRLLRNNLLYSRNHHSPTNLPFSHREGRTWFAPLGLHVRIFRVSDGGWFLIESLDGYWEGTAQAENLQALSPLEQLADAADD